MIAIRISMILVFILSGCSGICMDSGIEGSYGLTAKGVNYTLHLKSGGEATLAIAERTVGDLHWRLTSASNQQVLELDASGDVYASLLGIDDTAKPAVGAISVTEGIFGPWPKCDRNGQLVKLVLNEDESLEFRRIKNHR